MSSLVLHVDMDAFFASVEMRSDPRLAGKPLAVGGGPSGRGVVTTASYAAREYGVRSGMSLARALIRCPHLLVLPVNGPKVVHESLMVLRVLDQFSPRVEAASIDEAYLELPPVPDAVWEIEAARAGHRIQQEILRQRGLPCSVGIGVNKLQARMATPLGKPEGVSAIPPGRFLEIFSDRPVSLIPGVGPKTTEILNQEGIRTVGDLASSRVSPARSGPWVSFLHDQARGLDDRPVHAEGEEPLPKSAGHETTFSMDTADPRFLRATLWLLADRVARRLRKHGYVARTVVVRFKVGMKRYSRQQVLDHPTDTPWKLSRVAWRLLEESRRGRALRLLGVAGSRLENSAQEELLFSRERDQRTVLQVEDRIRDRFGEGAILPGTVLLREDHAS